MSAKRKIVARRSTSVEGRTTTKHASAAQAKNTVAALSRTDSSLRGCSNLDVVVLAVHLLPVAFEKSTRKMSQLECRRFQKKGRTVDVLLGDEHVAAEVDAPRVTLVEPGGASSNDSNLRLPHRLPPLALWVVMLGKVPQSPNPQYTRARALPR